MRALLTGLLLIFSIQAISSCSHVREYSQYDEINTAAFGMEVEISLIHGNKLLGTYIHVGPDSTRWYDNESLTYKKVSTPLVRQIAIRNEKLGFIDGFKIGFGIGLGFGLWAATQSDAFFKLEHMTSDELVYWEIANGLLFGGLISPVGATISSKEVYVISTDNPPMQLISNGEIPLIILSGHD